MKTVRGLFHRFELFHMHTNVGWRPLLDLYETEEDLIVLVEMAGIEKNDVEINVRREQVQLLGNRCRPSEREVTRIHQMDLEFGPYDQIIALPEPVDPSGSTSTHRDGFLLIRLPKEVKTDSTNP